MSTTDVTAHYELDFDDFNSRWRKARASAIYNVAGPEFFKVRSEESEEELLARFISEVSNTDTAEKEKKIQDLHRALFDRSRLLAQSLSKFLGLTFELQDFQEILSKSDIPCAKGQWEKRETARVLTRKGCDFCTQAGSQACDYWREAFDGLVMGLGEKERMARHASVRHGDLLCTDVFYNDSLKASEESLAWGPVPEHMAPVLEEVRQDFEVKMKTPIVIKGIKEGTLFFELKQATDNQCGGGQLLIDTFARKVQKQYPGLRVQEITPRAVLGVEK